MSSQFKRPQPTPTPVSAPYWQGLNKQEIHLQQCSPCGAWVFYPRSRCPNCLSADLTWRQVSGGGTVYTFTVARQPTAPHFAADVPQLLVVVELDEGVRMTSTLVDVDPEMIRVGMRVRPVFAALDADTTLLRFTPE